MSFVFLLFLYLYFIFKIWNSTNGLNLHVLPSVEDAEITGIVFTDKGVISVGWSRKIVKYPDIISEVNIHFNKFISC